MQRSALRPAAVANGPLFAAALARYQRRCQLWHSARHRLGDETFFANLAAVERSVADQLAREFGPSRG